MNAKRLAAMLTDALSFDTETHMIQPGLAAPPLVCGSVAKWDPATRTVRGAALDKEQTRAAFLAMLANEGFTITGANIAYDMIVMAVDFASRGVDVLPAIFRAYEAGRVFDIQLAEALHHIALGLLGKDPRTGKKLQDPITKKQGRYSLAITHDLVHGEKGAKANDRFRKSFALLEPFPMSEWPADATQYMVDDAVNTHRDALAQAGLIPNTGTHEFGEGTVCQHCKAQLAPGLDPKCVSTYPRRNIHDLSTQCYSHFAMSLGAAWGLTPDPIATAKLKFEAMKDIAVDVVPFVDEGILELGNDGKYHEKQNRLMYLVAVAYGAKDACPVCKDTKLARGRGANKTYEPAPGRVPSPATNGRTLINCEACSGTGLFLVPSVPRTETGQVGKGRDPLAESGNELLMSYAAFGEDKKIGDVYVPFLEKGIPEHLRLREDEFTPEGLAACIARIEATRALGGRIAFPITLSPNALLETNRASYNGVIQLLPRDGGVRECFVARDGTVYYSNDYTGLELAAWAQICLWMLGHSELAVAINSGLNVHGSLGAQMAGIPYATLMERIAAGDKQAKDFRGAAKWGNFGFMGGMAELRLVHQVRQQGSDTEHPTGPVLRKGKRVYRGQRFCLMIGNRPRCGEKMITVYNKEDIAPTCDACIQCSKWIKGEWKKKWTEADEYFARIKKIANQGWQKHPISERVRGGVGFCDGANGFFQELAAQGAKDALRHVIREQYDADYRPADLGGERSILYQNSRTIVFAHDELIGEARIDIAPEIAERVGLVMEKRMGLYIRDVKCPTEPTLMPRWYKAAACVRDPNGRLLVWQPKAKAA